MEFRQVAAKFSLLHAKIYEKPLYDDVASLFQFATSMSIAPCDPMFWKYINECNEYTRITCQDEADEANPC